LQLLELGPIDAGYPITFIKAPKAAREDQSFKRLCNRVDHSDELRVLFHTDCSREKDLLLVIRLTYYVFLGIQFYVTDVCEARNESCEVFLPVLDVVIHLPHPTVYPKEADMLELASRDLRPSHNDFLASQESHFELSNLREVTES
jgi:hypothetical protein